MVDYELPSPIKGWVQTRALYDMDDSIQGYEPCTLFALTSYKNRTVTLKILLDDGSLFSFIPLHVFTSLHPASTDENSWLNLEDLAYRNCPDYEMALTNPKFLQGKLHCYFIRHDLWMDGKYVCSLDWHKQNLILHFIQLENGQVATLPSHKVKFQEGEKSFRDFKKIHDIWQVQP